jgi:hypothetical protein
MDNNKASAAFQIIGILAIIAGVLTLIVLIGIPLLIGGIKYANKYAKMTDYELQEPAVKSSVLRWTVLICIFAFPAGLLSLLPYFTAYN